MKAKTKTRIYVCHTFYHVYVSLLKEMEHWRKGEIPEERKAELALSSMSMDFEDLGDRIRESGIFREVHTLNEQRDVNFPDLMKLKENKGNILLHLFNRLRYTKKYAKKQADYIDIDFRQYEDIYVYCDSDPIGYYLNYHHIPYHAVEDGLDCLLRFDAAHVDNEGHFELKAFLARHNLIFIQNGYSKYCLDMEINDDTAIPYQFDKYRVVPRKTLEKALTEQQKEQLVRIFLKDYAIIFEEIRRHEDCVLFLTEGYPEEREIRAKVAAEIIDEFGAEGHVVIKPHPRDDVDYRAIFPECTVIRGKFPIEVLNHIPGIHFRKAVSIVTSALDEMDFVDEKINLGPSIWDKYEPEEKHAFMKRPYQANYRDTNNK